MINFDDWVNNYISILNTIFHEFLTISINKGITISNEQRAFNDFCYMIYSNSRNYKLYNPDNFEYIN